MNNKNTLTLPNKKSNFINHIKRMWMLYLFVVPMLAYLIIFHYFPLYGIQIAFKNFRAIDGILGSKWVGTKHFVTFFHSYNFKTLLSNTLILSFYQIVVGFPIPIILALLLNYITSKRLKKSSQMILYAPHFISTVVFCGMITIFLSSDGVINQIIMATGLEPVKFLSNPKNFRDVYVWSGVLQNMGWGSILYVSVLTSVDPTLHEAAIVDGASKFQRMLHIDVPSIVPTMVIMLIMRLGEVMNIGFEKVYLLQNDVNLQYSEIISTYVYKVGLQSQQFSYSAAIGLFNNVINFILLITVNKISKKVSSISLW